MLGIRPAKVEDLCVRIPDMYHEEIDNSLTELQQEGLIQYRIEDEKWVIKSDLTE